MTKRVIVSCISVIDVEIFSSVDNYIAYVGYPWQDWIDDEHVYEEDGRILEFSIQQEFDLQYVRTENKINDLNKAMNKYIRVLKIRPLYLRSTADMIDCIIKFRGITV